MTIAATRGLGYNVIRVEDGSDTRLVLPVRLFVYKTFLI